MIYDRSVATFNGKTPLNDKNIHKIIHNYMNYIINDRQFLLLLKKMRLTI